MIAYSVIVPIMPFVINALQHGTSIDLGPSPYHTTLSNEGHVSKETGVLLAFFSIGLLIGSPLLGYLADRMTHRRWPMLGGIVGLLIAMLLFLFADAYWQLCLARLLQGFSDACVWTLGMCLMADTFPLEELGTQMGKVLVFHSIGVVAGSPIGGKANKELNMNKTLYQSFGYKAPFILCLCLAGIDLLLRLFLIERRHSVWFDTLPKEEEDKEEIHTISLKQLLQNHRLLAALVLAFANGCVCNVFEPTLTLRLSNEWGYNASQIGLVFLAQMAPTFIATPLAGVMADTFGSNWVCSVSL
ncbi:putative MFS-type transporter C18.02, partial [Choanephora cucurbitarum]